MELLLPLIFLLLVAGGIALVVRQQRRTREFEANPPQAVPVGYTYEGQPIYPVVGYTANGTPVTADQVPAGTVMSPGRMNSVAIASLILAFVFPIAAIPLGHIARGEIRQSGEDGAGLALAGLIISYVWLALIAVVVAVVAFGL